MNEMKRQRRLRNRRCIRQASKAATPRSVVPAVSGDADAEARLTRAGPGTIRTCTSSSSHTRALRKRCARWSRHRSEPADGNRVTIEWRRMSEVSGFGPYTEVGHSVACTFEGKPVIYVFQAFLDSESPTLAGREILGFPKRHGEPDLKIVREVLTGTLTYGGVQVALATMPYRMVDLSDRLAEIEQELQTTQLVLKLLPDVDNHTPKVAQLVRVNLYDVRLRGAWGGPAELFMVPHVGCPVAALPVVRVLEGRQHLWDMTLSDGQVVHDYLEAERR